MPTARARIATDRAARYLTQLCGHLNQVGGHGGGPAAEIRRVESSDGHGIIEFASGACTLHATGDALNLTVSAVDATELRRLQQALSARIATIGRRDNLSLIW